MSADRLFYYAPQKVAVHDFMHHVGAPITRDNPHAIHEAEQLRGLRHITFINNLADAHPIPEDIWEMIRVRGALVLNISEGGDYGRVHVTHHKGQRDANAAR